MREPELTTKWMPLTSGPCKGGQNPPLPIGSPRPPAPMGSGGLQLKPKSDVFAGRCLECGQVVAILVANAGPSHRKQTFVEWVKEGLGIERIDSVEAINAMIGSNCSCR